MKLFFKKTLSSAKSRSSIILPALLVMATLATTQAARADEYAFTVSGSGIDASGRINVTPTGPNGAYTITGITGNFSDTNNGFSGAITGLEFAPPPTLNLPPDPSGTFAAPAFTPGFVFSFDNLFYPDGLSPAVCKDALGFFGGVFDIYGIAFDVTGGYIADIWSDGGLGGYQVGDQFNGVKLSPDGEGVGFGVDVTTSPVPEPSSLLLLGTGLPGLVAVLRRKRKMTA